MREMIRELCPLSRYAEVTEIWIEAEVEVMSDF